MQTLVSPALATASLDEGWQFFFNDYAIEHQGGATIDLLVRCNYKQEIRATNLRKYPERTQIYNYIDNYLKTYPNETDFWEILNKNLVLDLLTQPILTVFGIEYRLADVADSLTVELDVLQGSSDIPVPRSSIVTGSPGIELVNDVPQSNVVDLDEGWKFKFDDYAIEHQGNTTLDLCISYNYIDSIGIEDPSEYPEFTQIYNYIDKYLKTYHNETDSWETLNKNLVSALLTEPIPTTFGFDYQLADVVDSLTVELDVLQRSSNISRSRRVLSQKLRTVMDLNEIL
jgi:hypothetical protein